MKAIATLKTFLYPFQQNREDSMYWYVKDDYQIFYEGRLVTRVEIPRIGSIVLVVDDIHDMSENIEVFDDDTYHVEKITVFKQIEW